MVIENGYNEGRRIVCAANRLVWGGKTYLFLGARHFDARMRESIDNVLKSFMVMSEEHENEFYEAQEQGFIDTWGTFHNRKDALIIAKYHNQIVRPSTYETDELFSENLY